MPADFSNASYVIMRGTREVGIADLKPWELLYVTQSGNGVDWSFTVVDRKVTGVLEIVQQNNERLSPALTTTGRVFNVRVAGTNYSVTDSVYAASPTMHAQISTNNGDNFVQLTPAEAGKLIGEQVTLYLDHSGDVVYMVGDAKGIGAAGNYGQVVNVNPTSGTVVGATYLGVTGIASVELLLANGTKTTYLVDGSSRINTHDGNKIEAFSSIKRGDFVEFRLRGDGRVDRMTNVTDRIALLTEGTTPGGVQDDSNRINIAGNWFLAGDAVVFNVTTTGTEVERIANFSMVKDSLDITNVFYVTSGNRVTHLAVYTEQLGAAVSYAVVMETGADRDGSYIRLMDSKGTITRYDTDTILGRTTGTVEEMALKARLENAGFKSVVNFSATGGDLTDITEVVNNVRGGNVIATVTAIDRTGQGSVRLQNITTGVAPNNVWYSLDSDTVLYNLDGTPRVITLADLAVGDQVVFGEIIGMITEGQFNFLAVRN